MSVNLTYYDRKSEINEANVPTVKVDSTVEKILFWNAR